MAKRLEEIKNMVEAMDGDFTAQLFGYEMNGQSVVDDLKWLVDQAEKTLRYEKAMKEIKRTITPEQAEILLKYNV